MESLETLHVNTQMNEVTLCKFQGRDGKPLEPGLRVSQNATWFIFSPVATISRLLLLGQVKYVSVNLHKEYEVENSSHQRENQQLRFGNHLILYKCFTTTAMKLAQCYYIYMCVSHTKFQVIPFSIVKDICDFPICKFALHNH